MLVVTDKGNVTIFRGYVRLVEGTMFLTATGKYKNVFSIDEELYIKTGEIKKLEAVHV